MKSPRSFFPLIEVNVLNSLHVLAVAKDTAMWGTERVRKIRVTTKTSMESCVAI